MDKDAIANIVETIAWGADLHQWDAVRAAFAEEAILDYGTPERLTPEQIIGRWQPLLEAFDGTRHALSEMKIQINGGKASVETRFDARHILKGAPGGDWWRLTGRYEHDLVKTPDGWKVTRMRMIPDQSTGNAKLAEGAQQRAAQPRGTEAEALRAKNREVVHTFFQRLEAFDIEGFANLFAEDGRQIMPFSPEGLPKSLERRTAVFNQYKDMPRNFTRMRFPDLVIQDLADPGRFFATFRGEIGLRSGGEYNNTYASLFVIRDGKIAEYYEYFDPIVFQKAFGAAPQDSFNGGEVRVEKVSFQSEGTKLVGNLYLPAGSPAGSKLPAVVVAGSWTTVKEQMPALYAERMAAQGYAALTFDFRGYGESEGQTRDVESPARKTEDFRNAVSYLQSLPTVDSQRIGMLGVCASSGYMAAAVAEDDRVRSLALVAPWLHDPAMARQVYNAWSPVEGKEGYEARLDLAGAAREKFERTGEVEYVPAASASDPAAAMYGPVDYYLDPQRGGIPAWGNRFAVMAWDEWLRYDALVSAPGVEVPVLMVHSEEAAIPDGARRFYQDLKAPKEFLWMAGNTQFDFYDKLETVDKAVRAVGRHFEDTLGR